MTQNLSSFSKRHNGLSSDDVEQMLSIIGSDSMEALIRDTVPESILRSGLLKDLPAPMSEMEYLNHLRDLFGSASQDTSLIGQGYYRSHTPSVIQRSILENPGWYTAYTPYQAEIAQGRLEALFNFQSVVVELTGLPIANASLLDEATAAAEGAAMLFALKNKRNIASKNRLLVDSNVFEQTKNVVQTRMSEMGVLVEEFNWKTPSIGDDVFAVLVQYPDAQGSVNDYTFLDNSLKEKNAGLIVAADLLSLCIFKSPQVWNPDVIVGSTQRFGLPLWYGGPHAAYFATKEKYKRHIPGRIIGVSKNRDGEEAYRMALQTREQHIRREKATSNICTAQALLAICAGMYAVYHGPTGLREIAMRIHGYTSILHEALRNEGFELLTGENFFDTLAVRMDSAKLKVVKQNAEKNNYRLFFLENEVRLSLDEQISMSEVKDLLQIFGLDSDIDQDFSSDLSSSMGRDSDYMLQDVFGSYKTETSMMRYIKSLENKDFSLVHGMIPLGSCTMKLNAAVQLLPLTWPAMANAHPFIPLEELPGYKSMIEGLREYLGIITGLPYVSLQPNSGAQGEFTGLLVIKKYHESKGDKDRSIVLIPTSAHGTNPASAVMAGLDVVLVATDERGNIDIEDLKSKAEMHKEELCALMVTYPSTHGVYESQIVDICEIVHQNGGFVYMDGANMNAQVGVTNPGVIGVDVCHLNLHKTFAIPHGGGGPGMGPICMNEKLMPFMPKQDYFGKDEIGENVAVSAAEYGSSAILAISYGYIRLLGAHGLETATSQAILNANYLMERLKKDYEILYSGENNRVAHEFIIDLRAFKTLGVEAEDVAKRLMDYGFHAPTLSFPVAGTLMIEPTESEDLRELDRFVDSMLGIREEIKEIEKGIYSREDNVLINAPHTMKHALTDTWKHEYTRRKAVFPLEGMESKKFWPSSSRIDQAYGDRNLICACPPIESYAQTEA